jgi:hypothetical protein
MTFLTVAARRLSFSRLTVSKRTFSALAQFEDYGKNVFAGKVADEYLSKHGASGDVLKDPTWVNTHSDVVANAVFDWYVISIYLSFRKNCIHRELTLRMYYCSLDIIILYPLGPSTTVPTSIATGFSPWDPAVSVTARQVRSIT